MEPKNTQGKKHSDTTLLGGLKGISEIEIFSKDFFITHGKKVIVFAVLLLFYINNRYACLNKLDEIEKLKTQLQDIKYEALTRSSELIGISRPSQVKELIHNHGIELEESNTPPYNLND
ncbi:MAG: FtsL-like putative cell division protein [Bacteroidales bacterium]